MPAARLVPVATALTIAAALTPSLGRAQPASTEDVGRINAELQRLRAAITSIDPQSRAARWLPDVEVYAKAAEWIVRHEEFYRPRYVEDTLAALGTGRKRAAELTGNPGTRRPSWLEGTGTVVLGYRSEVDGSVQPYALTLPGGIEPRSPRRWPLYLKLHGRGGTLNEVSFIRQHDGGPLPEGQDWIQLDVFGRTNNAYRWSGETDVFEGLADVQRRFRTDEQRITLWGFSMGGAGAWHLGLHHPSRWSSAGAGAGFVDFYKYQNVREPLPDYQHKPLHIYDAVDYALNAADVPFITYGGELDKQLAAGLMMQEAMQGLDVPLTLLIGKGMGHKFDDESFAKFMAFHRKHSERGRPRSPGRRNIRFVTWTPKYNRCEWLTIEEMDELYEPARAQSRFDDEGLLHLTTENIAALRISRGIADRVMIDEEGPFELSTAAGGRLPDVYFVRDQDQWAGLDYDDSLDFADNPDLRKRHDLQGPIDDAFMQPFVCVKGTGTPWSPPHQAWADWTLARFQREFDKWLRGTVPVIEDRELTDEDIAGRNLILFGDPGSNSVLAKVLDRLPIEWMREGITVNGQTYDPHTHSVALIYPNPLNPRRYVVVNSGHTMHERDFKASNSWLFPKLGDIAVQRFEHRQDGGYSEGVVWAGLFDADWNLR